MLPSPETRHPYSPSPAPSHHAADGPAHAEPGHTQDDDDAARAHLAHHFDTPEQQFDAAKLGMWIFLGTEVLMFGGLFCLYAVFRSLYPAAFAWGAGFLDIGWGTINTVVLLLSSLTMALAVHCARTDQRQLLMLFLTLTITCGVIFMGVKVIEYSEKIEARMLWGREFRPDPKKWEATAPALPAASGVAALAGGGAGGAGGLAPVTPEELLAAGNAGRSEAELVRGRTLYLSSCAACHGPAGEGIAGLGLPLVDTPWMRNATEAKMMEILREGRQPGSPESQMNALMPARGGNPFLTDDELRMIAGFVLSRAQDGSIADAPPTRAEIEALIPRWIGWREPPADQGLAAEFRTPPAPIAPLGPGAPPAHADKYFSLYFLMTGLHGVHLVIGLGVVGWLLWGASRWRFGSEYHTPVEMGGLYWHLVDLVWIFLFPLLYLVH